MMKLLFILFIFLREIATLKFSSIEDVQPIVVSKETRTLRISKDDLLVVLDREPNYVILGGRNAAYNISLWDVNIRHTIGWPTNNSTRHDCSMIISSNCDNFIRSYYKTKDGFVLCGTHGQRPNCRRYTGGWHDPRLVDSFPAEGLAPFTPTVKAPFVESEGRIFTANAPEYSTAADAILLRKTMNKKEKAIRTARGESVFDSAEFIAMENNGNEILSFFSELPMDSEGCGLRRVTRVARVCKDDPGAISFPDEWSSFVKARLECSVTQDGYDSLLFNHLTSLVSSDNSIAGVFRSHLAGLGFSAICIFPRSTISTTLASLFSNKNKCPKATDDALQRNLRGSPLIQKKIKSAPQFVYSGADDVEAMTVQHNVTDLFGNEHDIFYLGTSKGEILKIVIGSGGARHVTTLSIDSSSSVKSLWLKQEPLANQKTTTSLFLLSDSTLSKLPSTTCSKATNCSSCLGMGDPQCAWIEGGTECVAVEENNFRREYLTQKLDKCPKPLVTAAIQSKTLGNVPCLCEKAECVTQVIQKELQPIYSTTGILENIFIFSLGLLIGGLLNYCCKYKKAEKLGRLDRLDRTYSCPPLRASPRTSSMHSSMVYC